MVRCHVKVEEPLGVLHLIEDLGRIEHAGNQRTDDWVGAKLIGVEEDVHATIRFDLFEAPEQLVVRAVFLKPLIHLERKVEPLVELGRAIRPLAIRLDVDHHSRM